MSRYILIRRLRVPAFLLLVGVNALLNQADILSWGHSWPFYLILFGVFSLAERAAIASEGYPQWPVSPQSGWSQQPPVAPAYPPAPPQPNAQPSNSVIPTIPLEVIKKNPEGGQQ